METVGIVLGVLYGIVVVGLFIRHLYWERWEDDGGGPNDEPPDGHGGPGGDGPVGRTEAALTASGRPAVDRPFGSGWGPGREGDR